MAKRKPVVIKTPYPTLEETRKKFGISKKAVKQLEKSLNKIWDEMFKTRKQRR